MNGNVEPFPMRGEAEPARPEIANLEAEQGLLGAIMGDNRAFDRVADFLRPEHFYSDEHREIYHALGRMIEAGERADCIRLASRFADRLDHVGGKEYLTKLQGNFISIINARDYGQTILDCYLRRQLCYLGEDMQARAAAPDPDDGPDAMLEWASGAIGTLSESGQREGGLKPLAASLDAMLAETRAIQDGTAEPGIPTGYADLDRLTGGMARQDLVIVAGRPGMAKTSLAAGIAHHAASRDLRVAFFSLEMPGSAIARRIACGASGLAYERVMRRDGLTPEEARRFESYSADLRALPLLIDDAARLSAAQVAARCRGIQRRKGLDLVIVDHLGHMTPADPRAQRHLQLGQLTKDLKALAKRLNAPVVAICQLNRAVESRDDKRPHLADLREAGAIEEDADQVWFCYREHYYLSRRPPQIKDGEDDIDFAKRSNDWRRQCERIAPQGDVIVAKARNGPTGSVTLHFDGPSMWWSNAARPGQEEML